MPNRIDLMKTHKSLCINLMKFPHKFQHLKQENKNKKTLYDYYKMAVELAAENNGLLPKGIFKTHKGLYNNMMRYPDTFKDIRRS